ncbi:MAG TPA: nitroreductase family deazaflavin-dependent oxidoreductase [Candidatus Deferrimicrobium sp.]|nr:nitroreductase family deazaflavin-dependent oxidoreductase [Candidatus Deferrimicrobium sp.]
MNDKSDSERTDELPRTGSSIYKFNCSDEETRAKMLKKYKRVNKYLIIPLYRIGLLPAIGFGRIFLLLKTQGRTTGKTRRTPMEYHWINDVIHVFSARGEEADWIKNLRANPDNVEVRHGFHWFHPKAEFVENRSEKIDIFKWYVKKHSSAAKMLFGWNPKTDDPEKTNFSKLIDIITVVQLFRKS